MKLMAAVASAIGLASGAIAVPVMAAGIASAGPICEGADCVPYVDRSATLGDYCVFNYRYLYGVDPATNSTVICASVMEWVASPPLLGVYTYGQQCTVGAGVAQSPDGLPLTCDPQRGWTFDDSYMYHTGY